MSKHSNIPAKRTDPAAAPLALTIPMASSYSGLSRSSLYVAHKQGRLVFKKYGKRTLVCGESLRELLAALPAA